jgi:hypothetical protein
MKFPSAKARRANSIKIEGYYPILCLVFSLIRGFPSHYLPFAISCDKIASLNNALKSETSIYFN